MQPETGRDTLGRAVEGVAASGGGAALSLLVAQTLRGGVCEARHTPSRPLAATRDEGKVTSILNASLPPTVAPLTSKFKAFSVLAVGRTSFSRLFSWRRTLAKYLPGREESGRTPCEFFTANPCFLTVRASTFPCPLFGFCSSEASSSGCDEGGSTAASFCTVIALRGTGASSARFDLSVVSAVSALCSGVSRVPRNSCTIFVQTSRLRALTSWERN